MKRAAILSIICLLLLPASLVAQNRQRTTSKRNSQKSSSRAVDTSQKTTDARTDGATHVADQIKNLTRFIYLLGGVAKGIEASDAAAQQGNASQTVVEQPCMIPMEAA